MAIVAEKTRFAGVFARLQPYRLWIQTAFLWSGWTPSASAITASAPGLPLLRLPAGDLRLPHRRAGQFQRCT